MYLKETKNLTISPEIKLHSKSDENNAETQKMYNILFDQEERSIDPNNDKKYPIKDNAKPIFGDVSTLEWIKTWRAFEIS